MVFSILRKYRDEVCLLSDELQRFDRLLDKHNVALFKFRKYFDYLIDNKASTKISGEDGKAIATFFRPGFIEELASPALRGVKDSAPIKLFLDNLEHHTERTSGILHAHVATLKSHCSVLIVSIGELRNYTRVLGKYVGYKYRFKIFFSRPEAKKVITCSSCGQSLRVTPGGAAFRCPKCKTVVPSIQ